MDRLSALTEDEPSGGGEDKALLQARLAWRQAKQAAEAVAHTAGPEALAQLQAQARKDWAVSKWTCGAPRGKNQQPTRSKTPWDATVLQAARIEEHVDWSCR